MIEKTAVCKCGNRYSISWPIGSIYCTIGHRWDSGQWADEHVYELEDVTHWIPIPNTDSIAGK